MSQAWQDYLKSRGVDTAAGTTSQDTGTAGSIVGGLGSLYLGNQVAGGLGQTNQTINDQIGTLSTMYGPNSPYAQQLKQALARKDAAAGRNSQYGTREVELQARLAALQGANAKTIGDLSAQANKANIDQAQVRAQQLAHLFNIADKTGATAWANKQLSSVFNPNEMTYGRGTFGPNGYQSNGGGDYSTWSPGQTYTPETSYQSNGGMGEMYGPTEPSNYAPGMDTSQAPTSANNAYAMDEWWNQ